MSPITALLYYEERKWMFMNTINQSNQLIKITEQNGDALSASSSALPRHTKKKRNPFDRVSANAKVHGA